MGISIEEVKKENVLHKFGYNRSTIVAQVIAGIICAITSTYFFINYLSDMKTSFWNVNRYNAEKNMKTMFLVLGILMFIMGVICLVKVPAVRHSYLCINSKGVYGIAGKSYYFSTVSFTIPFDQLTNIYSKGNSIYIESGGDNFRVAIEESARAESIINNLRRNLSLTSNSNSFQNITVETTPKERELSDNEWKCPICGRVNQNYVGTCGCGEKKP